MDRRIWMGGVAVVGAMWATAAFAGASASNFRPENRLGANYWNAQSAIDGKPDTAWMVPGNSDNTGEHIFIDVPKTTVEQLSMIVGLAASEDKFFDYARVKSVKLEAFRYNDQSQLMAVPGVVEATFEDKMELQTIDIDDLIVEPNALGEGGRIKITVTEVYPGRDYPNFAMGEVLLHLTEMDAAPVISEVSSEADGHISMDLVDDSTRTFWAGDAEGATITFAAVGYGLSRVGLTPGPRSYARPKKVEVTIGMRSNTQELPDKPGAHWIDIPAVNGYTGGGWGDVQVKILEVYPGTNPQVAVAELDIKATQYEGF